MVAIWFIHELDKIQFFQEAQDLQIIELGPGRATLSSDILRVSMAMVAERCVFRNFKIVSCESPHSRKHC